MTSPCLRCTGSFLRIVIITACEDYQGASENSGPSQEAQPRQRYRSSRRYEFKHECCDHGRPLCQLEARSLEPLGGFGVRLINRRQVRQGERKGPGQRDVYRDLGRLRRGWQHLVRERELLAITKPFFKLIQLSDGPR